MTETKIEAKAGWNLDNSYAQLPQSFFTRLNPKPVSSPKLIILNRPLAKFLGFNFEKLKDNDDAAIFSGNEIPEGAVPIAQAYAGHQFGHFTMLGDGRALLLGEQITANGQRFDIQLKGSGRTPYSRGGDGRAALGPMLREYIISEAMYGLNIPTTRSLAVVTTGETVFREKEEIGAILTRVAASHLRVGTFQYVSNWCSVEELRVLADYTLKRHFPEIYNDEDCYFSMLKKIIKSQASLIAKWQLVGFIHGVMNTDNMTISGETIDYGPCAFMDSYNPETVFSSIDVYGRYSYGNQPNIAAWNLSRLAEALLPLISDNEKLAIKLVKDALSNFDDLYHNNWITGMRKKLGIFNIEVEDEALIGKLLSIMEKYGADYTNTFRALTLNKFDDMMIFDTEEFVKWHEMWLARLNRQNEPRESSYELMKNSNPAIIPRNHTVEDALEAAINGDYSVMEKLNDVLSSPFEYSVKQDEYAKLPKKRNCVYRTFCGT
ncbi:protein adenylyltransferase SelO [Clostridium drakei]|uniref:protein adenylyltransferase SelO n=1 Tax=Clostridium drakei TaxID=332101 RepID=UPI00190F723F|nr:YdiU family protein [Clostridium drakei]